MQEVGVTTLITGLAISVVGGVFLARKPQLQSKELPEQEVSRVTSSGVACASVASLEGVTVAFELPQNGSWSGRVTADGTVRIDVQPMIPMPEGAKVQVVIQTVPSTFATSVAVGSVLAEVTLEKTRTERPASATRGLTKREGLESRLLGPK